MCRPEHRTRNECAILDTGSHGRTVDATEGLDPEAAARANLTAVNVGSGELHEVLNTTDYSRPDSHARADCFFVIALAGFKDAERPLGYGFLRLGL